MGNRFLYLVLTAILFTMPVIAEDIVGYKGVKWGASLKVTTSKLKSESLNCSGRLLFNNSDAVKIVIQETGLDGIVDSYTSSSSSYGLDSGIKVKGVDDGCGVFLNNLFSAYTTTLKETPNEVRGKIDSKYGNPRIIQDGLVYLYEGTTGKIAMFVDRSIRLGNKTVLIYVSKDLSELAKIKNKANETVNKILEKEKKKKESKLDSL